MTLRHPIWLNYLRRIWTCHVDWSCHTFDWVIRWRLWMSHVAHMNKDIRRRIWMSHVTHRTEWSNAQFGWVMSHIWLKSCADVCEWVMSHVGLSDLMRSLEEARHRCSRAKDVCESIMSHMNESCRTWMSHVAHMSESSADVYEWVMSHMWLSPVPQSFGGGKSSGQ